MKRLFQRAQKLLSSNYENKHETSGKQKIYYAWKISKKRELLKSFWVSFKQRRINMVVTHFSEETEVLNWALFRKKKIVENKIKTVAITTM